MSVLVQIKFQIQYTTHENRQCLMSVTRGTNLVRNASHRASGVSLDNKPRVEYSYASGTKDNQYNRAQNVWQISRGRKLTVKYLSRGFRGTHVFGPVSRVVYCMVAQRIHRAFRICKSNAIYTIYIFLKVTVNYLCIKTTRKTMRYKRNCIPYTN